MKKTSLSICALLLLAALEGKAQLAPALHILNTFNISGTGGYDYLAIQPGTDKLYVSHGTQVNIINKTTGDSLGVIPNTTGVHGIAFVPYLNKGYTSNGRLNTLTVFDLQTDKVFGQLPVGQNPDAIMYDEFSKHLIVCNGRSKDVTLVDPENDKVTATIEVGGKPEEAVTNGAGTLYVNIEDKSEIVVIDLKSRQVLHHWPLSPGVAPTGLAIDTKSNRLFSTCSDSKQLMILDASNGTIINKVDIGAGCDGVVFDESSSWVYTSNGEGNITAFKQGDKNNFSLRSVIPTKKGARTIAFDATTHKMYLPTKENNVFQVLVVGK